MVNDQPQRHRMRGPEKSYRASPVPVKELLAVRVAKITTLK